MYVRCTLKMAPGSHHGWEPRREIHHADHTHTESFTGEKREKGAKERKGRRQEEKTDRRGGERKCRHNLVGIERKQQPAFYTHTERPHSIEPIMLSEPRVGQGIGQAPKGWV